MAFIVCASVGGNEIEMLDSGVIVKKRLAVRFCDTTAEEVAEVEARLLNTNPSPSLMTAIPDLDGVTDLEL